MSEIRVTYRTALVSQFTGISVERLMELLGGEPPTAEENARTLALVKTDPAVRAAMAVWETEGKS